MDIIANRLRPFFARSHQIHEELFKENYIGESQRMKGSRSNVEPRRGLKYCPDDVHSHTRWPTLDRIGPIVGYD